MESKKVQLEGWAADEFIVAHCPDYKWNGFEIPFATLAEIRKLNDLQIKNDLEPLFKIVCSYDENVQSSIVFIPENEKIRRSALFTAFPELYFDISEGLCWVELIEN